MLMNDKIKLLLFEDNEIVRKTFLEFAKKHSFELLGVSKNSSEILQQIKDHNPQAVILDLVVPGEDTLNLIEQIKSIDSRLPLIVCSSLKEEHIISQVLKAGCFDYIFKPFKEEDLLQSIKKAIA